MSKVLSIICSYYPDKNKLVQLTNTLLNISDVVIVNNENIELELNINSNNNGKSFFILNYGKNLGTLAAYNMVISQYKEYDYYWFWNQDTMITKENVIKFINNSMEIFKMNKNVVMTTVYDKKNFISPFDKNLVLAKESTSLIFKERFLIKNNYFFDDNLFMDYGDWDLSYRIYCCGNYVKQISDIKIEHTLGSPEDTIIGKLNRPSETRLFMQGINSVFLVKKYGVFNFLLLLLLIRFFLIWPKNIFFKNSFSRNRSFLLGIFAGIKNESSSDFMSKNITVD